MLPIECVVRGYLSGSGWKDYRATGAVCGHSCPRASSSRSSCRSRSSRPRRRRRAATTRTSTATRRPHSSAGSGSTRSSGSRSSSTAGSRSYARSRGIILADTKLEFGVDADGRLVLGDEAFTPDSSRFWPADEYAAGGAQPSYDKQFVRDYCEELGWDKTAPGPELPDDVVAGTRARYVEAFELLTEIPFDDYLANPSVVLA
jgi:Phosphoribosylaminoimidazolesuccinocarboxamide (SAICAR) synthase